MFLRRLFICIIHEIHQHQQTPEKLFRPSAANKITFLFQHTFFKRSNAQLSSANSEKSFSFPRAFFSFCGVFCELCELWGQSQMWACTLVQIKRRARSLFLCAPGNFFMFFGCLCWWRNAWELFNEFIMFVTLLFMDKDFDELEFYSRTSLFDDLICFSTVSYFDSFQRGFER